MADYTIIKMSHLSPVHIGTGRENYDMAASELHSDTISSALAAIGANTGLCDDIKAFISSFAISSAFPYYDKYFFMPRMQGRLNITVTDAEEHEYRKQLKKVRYIEQSLWLEMATGNNLKIKKSQIKGSFIVPDGTFADEEKPLIFKSQISQRVSVSRDGSKDAEPFFFDWHYYAENAGLYCITDAKGDTLDKVKELFTILGETGIGTDKSVGGGKFNVDTFPFTYNEPSEANKSVLLSLYIPTQDELAEIMNNGSTYSLIQRGGYMAGSTNSQFRHLRKKMVYAFCTGSVFETTYNLEGKVVDLQPDWNDNAMHPVYRSGKPIVFKIKQRL